MSMRHARSEMIFSELAFLASFSASALLSSSLNHFQPVTMAQGTALPG
jgi:hypothetical protein